MKIRVSCGMCVLNVDIDGGKLTKEELIAFEKEVATLWEMGGINAPIHLSGGNEDQLIEIFKEIKHHDYVFSSHRNHYHALLHGINPSSLMDEILGDSKSICKGRSRSMGFIDPNRHFYSSAIVGGCCAPAVGVAWALKEKEREWKEDPLNTDEFAVKPEKKHVWCFVGDGVLDGGHFWESLIYAHGWDLPITFVIEDNDRATKTDKVTRRGPRLEFWVLDTKMYKYNYIPTYPHVGIGKYVQF